LISKEPRVSLRNLPREGVSSNPDRRFENERLTITRNSTVQHPILLPWFRPAAAMTGALGSPESFGSHYSGHQMPPNQYQSVEKTNPNSSTRIMPPKMSQIESAATRERRRHCRPREAPIPRDIAQKLKRKAWGGRGEDDKLTQAEKLTTKTPEDLTRAQPNPSAPPQP
jgi:hypothetical protein